MNHSKVLKGISIYCLVLGIFEGDRGQAPVSYK